MYIKTSELEGAALDWAVAKALGAKVFRRARFTNFGEDMEMFDWFTAPVNWWADSWHPSSDWRQGGQIVDHYLIEFRTHYKERKILAWAAHEPSPSYGETHLVAACRAVVSIEIGDEVDVPEELL